MIQGGAEGEAQGARKGVFSLGGLQVADGGVVGVWNLD